MDLQMICVMKIYPQSGYIINNTAWDGADSIAASKYNEI